MSASAGVEAANLARGMVKIRLKMEGGPKGAHPLCAGQLGQQRGDDQAGNAHAVKRRGCRAAIPLSTSSPASLMSSPTMLR
jgi:hypothetical protein